MLTPRFVGSKIGLHPVWLIFALFVFSYLFGFVGMLVAVPIAAAIGVLVRFALRIYLESPVYPGTMRHRNPAPSGERSMRDHAMTRPSASAARSISPIAKRWAPRTFSSAAPTRRPSR